MNFTQSITTCMSKYATFSGTASRSEFWWFVLFAELLGYAASITDSLLNGPIDLTSTYYGENFFRLFDPNKVGRWNEFEIFFALLIPGFAAGSRRLHDIGKSGWWQLLMLTGIGIIPLVIWWARDTKNKDNRFKPKSSRSTKTRVSQ